MKNPNQLPPFTPVDLRAWIEGDSLLARLVGSIRLLQWIEGPDAELPLALINAAMPDVSPRQLKRVLSKARALGWLVVKRLARGRLGRSAYTYALVIEPMAFKVARDIINQRANLAPRSEAATGQLELTKGPETANQGATQAPPNIKKKDLQERPKRKAGSAKPSSMPRHQDQDAFWAQAQADWKAKFPGSELHWPGTKGSPPIRDFQKLLTGQLTAHGLPKMSKRWKHCLADDFSRPSLRVFIFDTDKWEAPPRIAGNGNSRRFNAPETQWRPSDHVIPRT